MHMEVGDRDLILQECGPFNQPGSSHPGPDPLGSVNTEQLNWVLVQTR